MWDIPGHLGLSPRLTGSSAGPHAARLLSCASDRNRTPVPGSPGIVPPPGWRQ